MIIALEIFLSKTLTGGCKHYLDFLDIAKQDRLAEFFERWWETWAARISYQILEKIGEMVIWIGSQEGPDSVCEHGRPFLGSKTDRQTVEILQEIVRNTG